MRNRALFAQAPVGRAVVSLVAPTVISQLITVIYNMADTFFIGQIGDPNQVAAVHQHAQRSCSYVPGQLVWHWRLPA